MRIKTEIPDIATKQDREDLSITSLLQTNSYTCYSAWPRKQVEQTKENWGKTSFNKVASKEVKVEDDAKVQCEDKDNSELNQQLDVHMKINSTAPSAELDLDSAAQKNAPQKDTGKEERYICYICDFSSSCKAGLISHVNRNKCRMKTSAVESPSKSIVHKRHHLSNEYVCTKCRSVFKKKASLDNHIIKQHTEYVASVSTRVHSCRNCDYKTTIRSSFRRHMQVHPKALRYDIDS
ncbi:unnamed protein product [Acanthoscelides obtectus]|nr:unnamed protein product [Acanthoscelides obtectus]CAK1675965.1 hypothetical protein AOBTE_LOCUS30516 [Acanthoscelides obtectus]